ncbi:hypothetical protein ACWD3I_24960 [Streptomyces sp. NPDC002817]|uniref:hypothetical protein n=1 Tax=Streptomyces sp. NPDC088357 TaxID=3154655 RepID=UPI00341A2649
MPRTTATSPADITELVELLETARGSIAYDADKDHYPRHHSERGEIDEVFDKLVDWARARMAPAELHKLVKPASDPDLKPGDVILMNNTPVTVREIRFRAPGEHQGSGQPAHHAAIEVVTAEGSQWLSLVPHPALAR